MNDTSEISRDNLSAARARWQKLVEAELKGASFEKKLVTRTFEGIALQPLYTRADTANLPGIDVPPGAAPFLRGVRPQGYKEQAWEVAQEIAARTPADFNRALVADLMHGQNCVVLAADGPGPAVATLADLAQALDQVDLQAVPVHLRGGADATPLAALYLSHVRARGLSWSALGGGVTADPLGTWLRTGRLESPLGSLYDSLAGWTAWAATQAPQLHTIGVDATAWGDAGATAVQELAFGLAAAAEYLRELGARGVGAETAGARMQIRFAIGPQFFLEIAKFRAWRPLWTRVLTAFGAPTSAAARVRVQAATGSWNKTRLDPHVNMLRVTTEAFSAVLGGCDALHIAPFDAGFAEGNEFSRRIARNVHTLLAEEFSLREVADAAGGSWYVEKLTDELARKAWALFQDIEGRGGLAAALRAGYPQQLVAKATAEKTDAVAKRRLALVGTNLFPNLKEKPLPSHVPVAAVSAAPASPAAGWPAPAPGSAWPVRFEAALAAAPRGASVAQIARLTGEPAAATEAIVPVAAWRAAAPFEALRETADEVLQRTGTRPRVFLARMGPPVQHKARADFSAGFFAVGGFEVTGRQSFELPEPAAQAAAESGAPVVVLCSTDETYPVLVPAFAREVKRRQPAIKVVLAGLPPDPATAAAYTEAGVDEFIHVRANIAELLAKLLPTGTSS